MREAAEKRPTIGMPAEAAIPASTADLQLICFAIGGGEYGIEASATVEILQPSLLIPADVKRRGIVGNVQVHGVLCPVVEISSRFDGKVGPITPDCRIIICEQAGGLWGLLVDKVREILRVSGACRERGDRQGPEADDSLWTYLCRLDDRAIRILDLDKIAPLIPGASERN